MPVVPTFTLAATNVSLVSGTSFASAITITPVNGYQGTVKWTASGPSSLTNACFSLPNTVVQGATAASLTIYTSASACTNLSPLSRGAGVQPNLSAQGGSREGGLSTGHVVLAWLLAGSFGLCGLRTRRFRGVLLGVAGVMLMGMLSGGGSGGSTSNNTPVANPNNAPAGTYTITLTGTDTATASVTASTTFTLTVN